MVLDSLMLAFFVVMGVAFFWDLGGFASRMRERLEARPLTGAFYRRMPPWFLQAFGIWSIVFGIGCFVFVATR